MRIERNFTVSKEIAVQKLDVFIDELARRPFVDGISVKDFSKSWVDNVMTFSFKVKKGFLGATISGTIEVKETSAVMDLKLPGLLAALVPEEKIRGTINKEFDKLFNADGVA